MWRIGCAVYGAHSVSYRQVVEFLARNDVVVNVNAVHAQKRAGKLAEAKGEPVALPKFVWDVNKRPEIDW